MADIVPFPTQEPRADREPSAHPEVADDRPLRDVLGEVLREERHAQGRSLSEVADGAAVSLPYLSEVERGRKEVSSDLLAAICDELQLPLADLLERAVERLRPGAQRGTSIQLLAA